MFKERPYRVRKSFGRSETHTGILIYHPYDHIKCEGLICERNLVNHINFSIKKYSKCYKAIYIEHSLFAACILPLKIILSLYIKVMHRKFHIIIFLHCEWYYDISLLNLLKKIPSYANKDKLSVCDHFL